jgi:hypothetical protein
MDRAEWASVVREVNSKLKRAVAQNKKSANHLSVFQKSISNKQIPSI